jgi:protein-tyrosine phosphatase
VGIENAMIQAEVYWIDDIGVRLAILPRPRGDDLLAGEIASIKAQGVEMLVSLLTPGEAWELGLLEEEAYCGRCGLRFQAFPIEDRTTPEKHAPFRDLLDDLVHNLRAGMAVGIHCRAGIGRSSVVAACVMKRLGFDPHEAFERIGHARRCSVPDTEAQREWVLRYS